MVSTIVVFSDEFLSAYKSCSVMRLVLIIIFLSLFSINLQADSDFVFVKNGVVYAQIENKKSTTILRELEEKSGVEITLIGELNAFISLQIKGIAIESAIRKLVPQADAFIAEYDKGGELKKLIIYSSGDSYVSRLPEKTSERVNFINRQVGLSDDDTLGFLEEVIEGEGGSGTAERIAVIEVLQNIDGETARSLMEAMLHDKSEQVRIAAAKAYYYQGGEERSVQLLMQKFYQGSATEKYKIKELLSASTHPAVIFSSR